MEEDALQCAASEEIVVFGCHHGWSPQPSPLVSQKVVTTAIDRALGGRGRRNGSRLRKTWPPSLMPRAVTAVAALASLTAPRRHRLGPPLVDIAWDHHSHLTTPLAICVLHRRKSSSTSSHRLHLTRLQPPPGSVTLIHRGLRCFYRRPDLVRLNRMVRLAWPCSSYWKHITYNI